MTETSPRSSGHDVALVILAAGAGTRMRSQTPKPLHLLAGMPMLWHVHRAGQSSGPIATTIVVNRDATSDGRWRETDMPVQIAVQNPPRGTADAVAAALPGLGFAKWLLILFGDQPLLTAETVQRLLAAAVASEALVTLLTCHLPAAGPYGRIERDNLDRPVRVVEQKDDTPEGRGAPAEINSGMMVVDLAWARAAIPTIQPSPVTGEFYLPELVRVATGASVGGGSWPVATVDGDWNELRGVNDRTELADADRILRERIRRRHMLAGVTLVLPETIAIDEQVEIGNDTIIQPFSVIGRGTKIGSECEIGPFAHLDAATIGDGVTIRSSTVRESSMADTSDAGPYAHLRGGAVIGERAHVGNFAEIKASDIGPGVMIGHMSYVGDASVGAGTNIGAGTVTCNFDGVDKHRTTIGANVFVGSDTMLVAPVTLGDGSRTGAGSVVTKDVPEGAMVVGVPARTIRRRRTNEEEN